MIFLILSISLSILVLIVLITPFFRKYKYGIKSNVSNLAIFNSQKQELIQDLEDKRISKNQFDIALEELKNNLGHDLQDETEKESARKPILGVVLVSVLLIGVSTATYLSVGSYNYGAASNGMNAEIPTIPALITALEARIEATKPTNVQDLVLLAQLYQENQDYQKSESIYRKANNLSPNQPEILVQLAFAIVINNKGNFSGEPIELLEQTLKINPKNQDAAYMLGRHQFQIGNYEQAAIRWQKLLPLLNQVDANKVKQDIALAQKNAGIKQDSPSANSQNRKIFVTVSVASQIKTNPEHTVFISAHAKNGPPMPLAAQKLKVSDLPKSLVLDKSMSVIPNMSIENFDQIIVKARITASGSVESQAGDILGSVEVTDFSENYKIIIDTIK